MKVRVKINKDRLASAGVGQVPGFANGELGGEPAHPNLILVKREGQVDLLCTLEGNCVAVLERDGKAAKKG